MKKTTLLLISCVVLSCGSTKKSIEKKAPTPSITKENTVVIDKNTSPATSAEGTEKVNIPLPPAPPKPPKPPKQSIKTPTTIHTRWNSLLQKYVSEQGNVNYAKIKQNRSELDIYIDSLQENLPNDSWSKDKKLAYWINAYNALTIDLILRNYPLKSIKDIKDPWDQRLWKFGNKWINLNQIEHQILRKMGEPRIHFGIVCASFSCPKLQNKAFTATNIDAQLSAATKEFLADSKRNSISKNTLKISKIFKWFAKDFKTDGSLITFLNRYSEIEISSKAKKSYKDYNWSLND